VTFVLLGNAAPVNATGPAGATPGGATPATDPQGNLLGNTITQIGMRDGWDDEEEAALALSTDNDPVLAQIGNYVDAPARVKIGVLEVVDLWQYHAVPGDLPEWVESDDDELAQAISQWFSIRGHECTVGRPAGWDDSMSGSVRTALAALPPIGGGSGPWEHFEDTFSEGFRARWREHQLLVNAGRDALHAQHLGTAAQPAAFNWMCLSASAVAASAASTTLPGEITTAGGGLLRAQATYAHTVGTNQSTLTKTFTCNGSDALPVTVAKIGVLNAAAVGTLGYETLLGTSATLSLAGDNVAITHTITAG
jgi:hypothetical protein